MARYLIPKPIQRQREFIPGWGWQQMAILGVGGLSGFGLFLAFNALHLFPVVLRLVVFVVVAGIGAALAFPQPLGGTLYSRLQAGISFKRSIRHYLFDWNAPDWPE